MSELRVVPGLLEPASEHLGRIETMLSDAHQAAALSISGVLPAGADEVSATVTALFNDHAQAYLQLGARATGRLQQFAQTLVAATDAYLQAEQQALQVLRDDITTLEAPLIPYFEQVFGKPPTNITPITVPTDSSVGLIVGGTNNPFSTWTLKPITDLYLSNTAVNTLVYTPEQFWPLTPAFGGLTLGQSVAQGTTLVGQAIGTELAAGNQVTVWGTSQSAVILTNEIRNLMAAGSPDAGKLSFILTGDPNNPNGGVLERFTGGYIPVLDLLANGATPPDSPYTTAVYTNQYDAISNFPRYPLNVVSDLNAIVGAFNGQHAYTNARTYYQLPTSPDYTGHTTYYMSLDNTLPLLQPLRAMGTFGNAVADLVQPDLRVIVDMGYGSGEYANIPTPASLLAIPDLPVIGHDLITGTVQGLNAFGVDNGWLPQSEFPSAYPYLPVLDPGLHVNVGQPSVTALSLLTTAEGAAFADLGQIPPWDGYL